MARPPFNMYRACFFLMAVVIVSELGATLFAGISCFWLNVTTKAEIGACTPVVQIIREQWGEIVAAIFALMLAATRSGGPPPPPSSPPDDQE